MPSPRYPLRALLVEDSPADAELAIAQLERSGFDVAWQRVETEADYRAALDPQLDIILADFHLPSFSASAALELLDASGLDVPLIVVSGSIGEDTAVHVLRAGAADYLLKDRLARLGQAVQRARDERLLREERQAAQRSLQQSEERTRFALNAAQVGVWEVDLGTGSAHWSGTMEAHHGLGSGEFAGTFRAFLEAVHEDDRDAVRATIENVADRRTDSSMFYRSVWPDGSTHWISGVGRTFFDAAGRALRAAGVCLDTTERRALEEQYRQAQKMEAVGQLAGGVAHDFNNLLTAILGYCSLIRDGLGADSPHQADLREIRRAAESAGALTRQLLAFSRQQVLDPRVLDIRDVIRSMESMLRRLIGEDITLVVRTNQDVGRVKVDPGQVEQVILNLAVNARDAMPGGGTLLIEVSGVELTPAYVREHVETVQGHYVTLSVSDTGVGMDDRTRARIFEPFFTTKTKGRGTGLGLSTVYGIVRQSQGSIWVYSEPGRGSTFKVYFPRVDAPADADPATAAAGSLRGSEVILVVEDQHAVRELLKTVLTQQGYQVVTAASPAEALAAADRHEGPVHLLLSDLVLPEIDGRALADELSRRRPDTRALFMSGDTDHGVVHGGFLEDGTPFLQKPFTPDAVARKVREVLDES